MEEAARPGVHVLFPHLSWLIQKYARVAQAQIFGQAVAMTLAASVVFYVLTISFGAPLFRCVLCAPDVCPRTFTSAKQPPTANIFHEPPSLHPDRPTARIYYRPALLRRGQPCARLPPDLGPPLR